MNYDLEIEKRYHPENFEPECEECGDHEVEDENAEEWLCTACGYRKYK